MPPAAVINTSNTSQSPQEDFVRTPHQNCRQLAGKALNDISEEYPVLEDDGRLTTAVKDSSHERRSCHKKDVC